MERNEGRQKSVKLNEAIEEKSASPSKESMPRLLLTRSFRCFLETLKLELLNSSANKIAMTSTSQPAIKCSKLTIETLEQGVKYV